MGNSNGTENEDDKLKFSNVRKFNGSGSCNKCGISNLKYTVVLYTNGYGLVYCGGCADTETRKS